jgi:hypothetical protein
MEIGQVPAAASFFPEKSLFDQHSVPAIAPYITPLGIVILFRLKSNMYFNFVGNFHTCSTIVLLLLLFIGTLASS